MSPVARWAVRALRDLGLNVLGFGLVFAVVAILGVAVRTGMETLLRWGQPWLALVFVVVAAGAWATLFGLVRKKDLVNPEGKVLPLSAAGFLLGAAAVWVRKISSTSSPTRMPGTSSTSSRVWTSPARSAGRARSSSRVEPAGCCSCCSAWR